MRALVIGAGPNGLVCAAHLARAGVDVTVLEQGEGYGGISSAEGPLPGFRHDICSGFFPLTAASPAFRSLPLEVDWVVPEHVMAHPFDDGSAIELRRDIDATAAGLGPSGGQYAGFMRRLAGAAGPLMDTALQPVPPDAGTALRAARILRLDLARLAWRALEPAGILGRRWLGDERAAAWLAGSTAHSDLDPTSPGGGAFALVLTLLAHHVGWPYPRGGAAAIGAALVSDIEAHGGSVQHGVSVTEIVVDGGRTRAVRTSGGERLDADVVVATTTAKPLLALLGGAGLSRGIDFRLRHWRHDCGVFKVDFALSKPVPWAADECRRASVVHVGGSLADFVTSFRASRSGRFPERPAIVTGQHTLYDETRAPAGQHTLYTYVRSPLALDIPADEAADRVERRIEELAPGFRAGILGRTVRSPAALQEHNPALIGGDLGGGSYQLDQQLFLRPHPRLWRTRTPIRGLYFAGSSVHPGGGVHGTQGLAAARFALRDNRQ